MKDKKFWMIGAVLIVLSAASAFAAGAEEGDIDQTYGPRGYRGADTRDYGPRWGGGPAYEGGYCPVYGEEAEFDVYEGTFSMEKGIYPALTTDEGETYYLMPRFPIAADAVPEDGAEISVETLPAPMSPVHLMVFSATVDGVELESDWDSFPGGPGRGGYGMRGPGGPRGMRGGWNGAGPGMRGGSYDGEPRRPWPYWGQDLPETE